MEKYCFFQRLLEGILGIVLINNDLLSLCWLIYLKNHRKRLENMLLFAARVRGNIGKYCIFPKIFVFFFATRLLEGAKFRNMVADNREL